MLGKIFKLIINSNYRFLVLSSRGLHRNMDDKEFIEKEFNICMPYKLNLEHPITFNEKLQWLKLYDRQSSYSEMVDKYTSKAYVSKIIGEQYIVPTLGVWDRFEDIDFDVLPEKFVLKCTHDSGGIVICYDKKSLNIRKAKKKINKSLRKNYFHEHREWVYKDVKPRILAEKLLVENIGNGLTDYKFYCFNGRPKFLYVSKGLDNHKTATMIFLDLEWNPLPFRRIDFEKMESIPSKPSNLDEMILISEKLSQNHQFLRVDLYSIGGRIFFSELTFTPCAGMMVFEPQEYDYKVGELLDLENHN